MIKNVGIITIVLCLIKLWCKNQIYAFLHCSFVVLSGVDADDVFAADKGELMLVLADNFLRPRGDVRGLNSVIVKLRPSTVTTIRLADERTTSASRNGMMGLRLDNLAVEVDVEGLC